VAFQRRYTLTEGGNCIDVFFDRVLLSVPNSTSGPTCGPSGGGRGVLKIDLDRPSLPLEAIWTDRLTQLGKVSVPTWLTDRLDADLAF